MALTPSTSDWVNDFDILDPQYVADPYDIWAAMRGQCRIAHTERRGSTWMPLGFTDIVDIANDVEHFSSRRITVIPRDGDSLKGKVLTSGLPPISTDPPHHTWTRRLIQPWFSPAKIASYEPLTRDLCVERASHLQAKGRADAAGEYAQHVPVRVVAHILGVDSSMERTFTGWVQDVLEFAGDASRRQQGSQELLEYFLGALEDKRASGGDDLLSELLQTRVEGEPLPDRLILGIVILLLVAGVDTTWSAIGSSLWHLATHPDDRHALVEDPACIPAAVEEFLRAYSPVTMAREVNEDVVFGDCPMKAGDTVLMNFPAANRDPAVFERPEQVLLNRSENRHVAFGWGIHRCIGANLARMELRVAIEEWLRHIPDFALDAGGEVTWSGGQVRGPRRVPVVF